MFLDDLGETRVIDPLEVFELLRLVEDVLQLSGELVDIELFVGQGRLALQHVKLVVELVELFRLEQEHFVQVGVEGQDKVLLVLLGPVVLEDDAFLK